MTTPRNVVLQGDARETLASLPEGCVDCIVTSPPYYQQRDYGEAGQIGGEDTPQQYVARLADVFDEARRALSDRGLLWLVLGDKYDRGDLMGMPWRVCLELKDRGWLLRNEAIWHKPNAMPSAAKTRLTIDHEHVFLFAKQKDYHYNADAIREPHVTFTQKSRMKGGRNHFFKRGGTPEQGKNAGNNNLHHGNWDQAFHPKGRNRRTVWSIPLSKYRDAHFAVFPEKLVEICIQAGCPPGGVVLDPFLGSGVTALVAQRMGRDYVGIDLSEKYCKMAQQRLTSAVEERLTKEE